MILKISRDKKKHPVFAECSHQNMYVVQRPIPSSLHTQLCLAVLAGEKRGTDSQLFKMTAHAMRSDHQARYEAVIKSNEEFFTVDIIKEKIVYLYGTHKDSEGNLVFNCANADEMREGMLDIISICRGSE